MCLQTGRALQVLSASAHAPFARHYYPYTPANAPSGQQQVSARFWPASIWLPTCRDSPIYSCRGAPAMVGTVCSCLMVTLRAPYSPRPGFYVMTHRFTFFTAPCTQGTTTEQLLHNTLLGVKTGGCDRVDGQPRHCKHLQKVSYSWSWWTTRIIGNKPGVCLNLRNACLGKEAGSQTRACEEASRNHALSCSFLP